MNRLYCLLLAGMVLIFSSQAFGQGQEVSAALHAKTQGDDILVAVELSPSFGCHIYDDEDPGPVSLPSSVTFGGLGGAV